MNLIGMTDQKLSDLRRKVVNEIERRSTAATNGHDAAAIIHGNECAKRALVVAAAGGHSILFIGPPNCGKTMLRAAALELGLSETFEAWPCPCGWRSHRDSPCCCSAKQAERHIAKLPVADITVEMHAPTDRDMICRGTSLAEMKEQIACRSRHDSTQLDEFGRTLFKATINEMAIDAAAQQSILAVARTIANLDNSETINSAHVVEAVNYRPLLRWL
jgi:predicted ATPase with chaperone activity